MNERRQTQILVEERQALNVYFDALLREIPDLTDIPAAPKPESPAPVTATQPASLAEPAPTVCEPPPWGSQRFQAMLFKVAGLTLAVPLVELSGVQEWREQRVTPLPNHVSWFLGLARYREHSVPVADTAQLVLPEDRRQKLTTAAADRCTRIVYIDEGRWGLACDEVAEVVTLEPDQVRWRSARTTRAWLSGTVIKHMCALIDPTAFARMLATGVEDAGLELPGDEQA